MTNATKIKIIKQYAGDIIEKFNLTSPLAGEWIVAKNDMESIEKYIDELQAKLEQERIEHVYTYRDKQYKFNLSYNFRYNWLDIACPELNDLKNNCKQRFNSLNKEVYEHARKEYNKLLLKAETGNLSDEEFNKIYKLIIEDDND